MPKNKYESRCVINKNITDMKAAIKNTVKEVDIPRYMGVWHEIARYENHFEKDMVNVTATYTLQPDGSIKVENAGYRNGVFKKSNRTCETARSATTRQIKSFLLSMVLFRLLHTGTGSRKLWLCTGRKQYGQIFMDIESRKTTSGRYKGAAS